MVTVCNSDNAKLGKQLERQTTLKVYGDRRRPQTCEKLVEEKVQSHVKEFNRKLKANEKVNHKKREPVNGVLSSKSETSRAMRGYISYSKLFGHQKLQFRNKCLAGRINDSNNKSAPPTTLQQVSLSQVNQNADERSSGQIRKSENFYGFSEASSDFLITAPFNILALLSLKQSKQR